MIGALAVLGGAIPDRQNVVPKVVGLGYGPGAKSLHWLVVALLLVQFAIAWTMPGIRRGTCPDGLIGLHRSFNDLHKLVKINTDLTQEIHNFLSEKRQANKDVHG